MPSPTRVLAALALSGIIIGLVWWLSSTSSSVAPASPEIAVTQAKVPTWVMDKTTSGQPSLPPLPASQTGAVSDAIPVFDTTNLFSIFQLAQSTSDLAAIESGLAAWRTCAGYVGMGTDDLENWLNTVLPPGLPPAEREKRAKRGRASALRCAGFAGQTQALAEAEELSRRAQELGSLPEKLRSAIFGQPANLERDKKALAALSCEIVRTYPQSNRGIRLISIALNDARASRSTHFLNRFPDQARNVGINLAFCALDQAGCDVHSNFLGSACMQSGQCAYGREEDYWRSTTSPDVYMRAEDVRDALAQKVRNHECDSLFQ